MRQSLHFHVSSMPPKRCVDIDSPKGVPDVENELTFVEFIALTDGNRNLVIGAGDKVLGRNDLHREDKRVSRRHCNVHIKVRIL